MNEEQLKDKVDSSIFILLVALLVVVVSFLSVAGINGSNGEPKNEYYPDGSIRIFRNAHTKPVNMNVQNSKANALK